MSEIVRTNLRYQSGANMRLESVIPLPINLLPTDLDHIVGKTPLELDVKDLSNRTRESSEAEKR